MLGKLERGQVGAVSVKRLDVILDFLGYEIAFKRKDSSLVVWIFVLNFKLSS